MYTKRISYFPVPGTECSNGCIGDTACSILCASAKCSLYSSHWGYWHTECNVLPQDGFNYAGI